MKWVAGSIVAVLLLFVIALIGHEVFVRRAQARLNAALLPTGSPLTIAELKRTPPLPDENAALQLRAIGPELKILFERIKEIPSTTGDLYTASELTDTQATALASLFANHASLLRSLHEAAAAPTSDQLLDYSLQPPDFPGDVNPGADLTAARVLAVHAMLSRHNDQVKDAIESIATMLRMASHRDREPLIINNMLAAAIRKLAFDATQELVAGHQVSADAWKPIRMALGSSDDPARFERVMVSERVWMLAELRYQRSSSIMGLSHAWRLNRQAQHAELTQQVLAALSRPDPGRFTMSVTNPSADLEESVLLMVSALRGHCEDLARIRTLRCMIAVAEHDDGRQKKVVFRKDQQPTSEDLAESPPPIVLNDQWIDPFDGQPIRVLHTDAGWLIYSIGKDLVDNGGHLVANEQSPRPKDLGLGPLQTPLAKP